MAELSLLPVLKSFGRKYTARRPRVFGSFIYASRSAFRTTGFIRPTPFVFASVPLYLMGTAEATLPRTCCLRWRRSLSEDARPLFYVARHPFMGTVSQFYYILFSSAALPESTGILAANRLQALAAGFVAGFAVILSDILTGQSGW
jgi:hypothetical protein